MPDVVVGHSTSRCDLPDSDAPCYRTPGVRFFENRLGQTGNWLQLRLEGRYEMIDLVIEPLATDDFTPGELVNAHLRALGETGAAEFIIDRNRDNEATVATNADGMTALLRTVPMDEPSEADLLSADLITESNEPVYEAALRAAAVFLAAAQPSQEAA